MRNAVARVQLHERHEEESEMGWQAWREHLKRGEDLEREQMRTAVDTMMSGSLDMADMADFLAALHAKGETVEEIVGAAESLRAHMCRVVPARTDLVDTCGTGGDRSGTFNVSTAAAIVASACGVPIAKHGNRSVTSRSGSADVLEALGVAIDLEPEQVARCIDEAGIGFCYAPRLHPAMKHVAAARRQLGTATIFNLLGPLANPAGAPFQLIGVGLLDARRKLATALAQLGTRRSLLVQGQDGLDEITTTSDTDVAVVDGASVCEQQWRPEQFGIVRRNWSDTVVTSAEESARVIRSVLDGMRGVARDLVVMNAAAAIGLHRGSEDWATLAREAEEAIDAGKARHVLERWIEVSRS